MKKSLITLCFFIILLLTGCVTTHWDTEADLSMTDKDPWEYYTPYYLDYENGRMDVAFFEEASPDSSNLTPKISIFFNDVLQNTVSLDEISSSGQNPNDFIYKKHFSKEWGYLDLSGIPGWISEQLTAEEMVMLEQALSGDEEAAELFRIIAETKISTPWGNGIPCIARYFEGNQS